MGPCKYSPISLINIGGNVLEKFLINRPNQHMYKSGLLIDTQYGFTPQKSTTDAAREAKIFREPELEKKVSCHNEQHGRQMSFRRNVVAKHPTGLEGFRMP